jgi:hypothetical protein
MKLLFFSIHKIIISPNLCRHKQVKGVDNRSRSRAELLSFYGVSIKSRLARATLWVRGGSIQQGQDRESRAEAEPSQAIKKKSLFIDVYVIIDIPLFFCIKDH